MAMTTTREMFEHELADIYDAEHQFLGGQQKMRQNASDPRLQQMIQTHILETEGQIRTLEQVFLALGLEPKRQTCSGAKGLVEEGSKVMQEASLPELRDAAISVAAAKCEHYEIVAYKDLIGGAELLGKRKVVTLLEQIRGQELATARRLERSAPRLLQRAKQAE